MVKVFICTPHARAVSPAVTRHIWTMLSQPELIGKHEFMFTEVDSFVVGKARNMIVEATEEHNPDVLFWIDDDILVAPGSHTLIDQALEKGIVSGLYVARNAPYTPQMYRRAEGVSIEETYGERPVYWPVLEWEENTVIEVDSIGFGLVAIRWDIFEQMAIHHDAIFTEAADHLELATLDGQKHAPPEFKPIANIVRHLSPWFEFLNAKGEDMYWCERAKEAGHRIWVDTSIQAGHISDTPLALDHFKYLRDNGMILQAEDGEVTVLQEAQP